MPELSIIIPSFNTKKLLDNCLDSIYKQTKAFKYEVIVVDNASQDGTAELVKKKYPQVKLILNQQNLGFAKANNQALRQAQADYVLFLNSDTVILDQAIEKAVKFIKENKQVDILGCQLLNSDKTIQPSGGFLPKLRQIFFWMFFVDNLSFLNLYLKPYQQSNKKFYTKTQKLGWVTGAFFLARKKVIDKLSGFDEQFFMYSEEVDFCQRAKNFGFQIWFYPKAQIIHFKGKSSANGLEKAVLGEYEGIKKFFQKHKPKWELIFLRILLKLGAGLRMLIFGILKEDRIKLKIYEKAFKLA